MPGLNRALRLPCLALALSAALGAVASAAEAPAQLTLEQLYRAKPYKGQDAQDPSFSHSGHWLAYRWNPYGEPGSDLYVRNVETGQVLRLTSPQIMAAYDAPEDLARFEAKYRQQVDETAARQAREEAQQAYLRGEKVDLEQWDRADLARVKPEVEAKWTRDEAEKKADAAAAEVEKAAMARLEGAPAAAAASAPVGAIAAAASASAVAAAAPASAASMPAKADWEWRDELQKWREKNKLKPADLYPGVSEFVWAHRADELVFAYRGALFRWQASKGAHIEPLQATQRKLAVVAYTGDDAGYVFRDDKRVLRARFDRGGVDLINRELINADDAERKYAIEQTTLSEDGRWLAIVAQAPLAPPGDDGKPGPEPKARQVEIMDWTQRFATPKKVDREVSDDKQLVKPMALYIRRVPAAGEAPAKQAAPVFTNKGGDVWFETSDVVWARDASHYAFATWERERQLLRVYLGNADENAAPAVVLERRGDVGHEVVGVMQPHFTPDGRRVVLGLDAAGWRQPYAIDVATHALTRLVSGDFEAPEVLGFTPDSKAMFVTANKDDFASMNLLRVDLASGQATALGAAGEYYRASAVSFDGRWLAAMGGNWAARPELKLIDARKPGAELALTDSNDKAWAQVDVLHPERFSFANRHGDRIEGYVFKPPGWQASDRRPAVVYVYGGPLGDRHIVEVDSFQQTAYLFGMYMAARHGYVMIAVDPRGHSNYGRKFSDANWEHPGQPQAEDLEDAKAWAVAHLGVDTARVGLTGWSFGGFQTQYTMYTKPELFAAGIAGAGPTQWENYNSWYTGRTLDRLERGKPVLRKYSLLPLARNLEHPLLLVHGMVDPNVLFQDTVNVYRELLSSGKDALVELYLDPDGVHGLGGTVKPVGMHRKFEAFWLSHLGEGAKP
ncbi:MAG: prolyl oligopeptidase family serine peptidase [Pelomonas sp.]|nr:prolyl oligopeptidase family serine peptidase [Roseateles sp.]